MHCFRSLSRRSITSRSSVYRPQMAYLPSRSQVRQPLSLLTYLQDSCYRHTSSALLLTIQPLVERRGQQAQGRGRSWRASRWVGRCSTWARPQGPSYQTVGKATRRVYEWLEICPSRSRECKKDNDERFATPNSSLTSTDVSRAREGGIDKLAKKLFPMSDTLDICIQNKPDFESAAHKDNEHAKRAFDGIQAAKQQLVSILKDVNVEEVIPKLGEPVSFAIFSTNKNSSIHLIMMPCSKSILLLIKAYHQEQSDWFWRSAGSVTLYCLGKTKKI